MLEPLFPAASLYATGLTILHSFWQATLLALVLWWVSRWPRTSADIRYLLGVGLLLGQVVVSAVTFGYYYSPAPAGGPWKDVHAAAPLIVAVPEHVSQPGLFWSADFWLTALVAGWAASMIAGAVRLSWSYGQLRRLAGTAQPITATGEYALIFQEVARLANRIGYRGTLRLGLTERISGPMLVGHIRPILLFPVALVNQLTSEEAETVILHELAHLRRCDHLLHPVQCLVEVLFYYHPAIHWISARVREEREHCCDDLVLRHGPGRLPYARALLYFSEHPVAPAALSLAEGGGLLGRIRRFIDHQEIKYTMNHKLLLLPLLALLTLISTAAYAPDAEPVAADPGPALTIVKPALAAPDTLPPGDHLVTKISDGKTTRVRVEDGEITELELDGRAIPPEEFDEHEATAERLLGMESRPYHLRVWNDSAFRAPMHFGPLDSFPEMRARFYLDEMDYDDFHFDFQGLAERMDSLQGKLARIYHFEGEDGEFGFRWEGMDLDSFTMPELPEMPDIEFYQPYLRKIDELDLKAIEERERQLRDALRELEARKKKLSEEQDIRGEALYLAPAIDPAGEMERSIAQRKAAARQTREQHLAEGRRLREQPWNHAEVSPPVVAFAFQTTCPDVRRAIRMERLAPRLLDNDRMIIREVQRAVAPVRALRHVYPG
ncbi:M56 family metallopeptidase [Neolewinella litorea]|nr:M56 family metallopeptidase [Neolewinella litorea]